MFLGTIQYQSWGGRCGKAIRLRSAAWWRCPACGLTHLRPAFLESQRRNLAGALPGSWQRHRHNVFGGPADKTLCSYRHSWVDIPVDFGRMSQ